MLNPADVAHLLRRAGYGASDRDVQFLAAEHASLASLVDALLNDARLAAPPVYASPAPSASPPSCTGAEPYFETQALGRWVLDRMAASRFVLSRVSLNGIRKKKKRKKAQRQRDAEIAANAHVPHPLREKMTLFWHGLLVSSLDKDLVYCHHATLRAQNLVFRERALGDFGQLLSAASVDPAMLYYLDNWISTKDNPNENYARELLELFSLGVGSYGQDDVVSAARAGTGYTIQPATGVDSVFYAPIHDYADKTFLGRTGNWDLVGNAGAANTLDLVDHLVTASGQGAIAARTLARLLWQHFAYFTPSDAQVADVANASLASGRVQVRAALRALFTHAEFYGSAARTGKLRNPVEYVVALLRALALAAPYDAAQRLDVVQYLMSDMGIQLFHQPNVFGWWRRPESRWISVPAFQAKQLAAGYLALLAAQNASHPLRSWARGAPEQVMDAIFGALGSPQPATSSERSRGARLVSELRAAGTDEITLAVRAFQFAALSPPAQLA
jgi:uncharacterized protein (DUF1800 family)